MDFRHITAAAAHAFNLRINPTWRAEDERVLLAEADVKAISQAVGRAVNTVDSGRIWNLLGGRPAAGVELTVRDANQLARAMEHLGHAIDRDRKISRGQYVGPMSGAEALKFI